MQGFCKVEQIGRAGSGHRRNSVKVFFLQNGHLSHGRKEANGILDQIEKDLVQRAGISLDRGQAFGRLESDLGPYLLRRLYGSDESPEDGNLYATCLEHLNTPPTESEVLRGSLDARPEHAEAASALIRERWAAVDALAVALLDALRLTGDEITAIIEAAGFEPIADLWMERRADLIADGTLLTGDDGQ